MDMTKTKLLALLSPLAMLAGCNPFAEPTVAEREADEWPLVERYCTDCHNGAELAGGLDFERIGPHNVAQNAERLELAVRKLRSHSMPPRSRHDCAPDACTAACRCWSARRCSARTVQPAARSCLLTSPPIPPVAPSAVCPNRSGAPRAMCLASKSPASRRVRPRTKRA